MGNPYITDLIAVDNAIFVVDLISKTRDAGLSWQQLAPNLYTTTLQEQCLPPSSDSPSTWMFYVGKNRANDTAISYVYYIDVLLNSILDISTDSRQTNYVEQLFQAIELSQVPQTSWNIDQAIDFISNIPTNPSSSTFAVTMCGGIIVDGAAIYAISSNKTTTGGVKVGGVAVVTQNFEILAANSFVYANGSVTHNAQLTIESNSFVPTIGTVFCFAQTILESNNSIQAIGNTFVPLKSDSVIEATSNAIYAAESLLEANTSIQATSTTVLTLTGPSVGPLNTWSTSFSVKPGSLFTGIITPNDGSNGGTFDPPTLTFTNSTSPQSFTYTTASGLLTPITVPISITSTSPGFYIGSPINYSAEVAIFLHAPPDGTIGVPAPLIVFPSVPYTGLVGFNDGSRGGVFTPVALTFTNGFPQTATYTPAGPGAISLKLGSIPEVPLYLNLDTHFDLPRTIFVT